MIPGNINTDLISGADEVGYQISRSLRFNSSDSAYLSRTPASAGNRRTFTWSGWIKRGTLTTGYQTIFGAGTGLTSWGGIRINNSPYHDKIQVFEYIGGWVYDLTTTAVFRDPSAWYHLIVAVDTTQATASNRVKIYINGAQLTAFDVATYPAQNTDLFINSTNVHTLGTVPTPNQEYFSGYLAECYLIDGQQLTPSSFAETNATTGQWVPKAYTGSYGTNGFKLSFSNNASTTTISQDSSGNNNHWTANNISVTAGAGNDSLVDTPTSYGTDTGVGGEVRGNYCTWNPLANSAAQLTYSNGNLDIAQSNAASYALPIGTIGVSSGKWYWETIITSAGTCRTGVVRDGSSLSTYLGSAATAYAYASGGYKSNNNSNSSTGYSTYTNGDIIGIALDLDNGAIYFSKNGTWQQSGNPVTQTNPAYTGLSGTYFASWGKDDYVATSCSINFGQRPFAYTAPSGFKALCDTSLPGPTIAKPSTVMDVKLYTGNGSTQTISGLGFSPDLVWNKNRSGANSHSLFDTIRGATKQLNSNLTDAESTDVDKLTAFTSDGFTVGNSPGVNASGNSYVAWTWDAGSSTVTNTQGSITSQVRANASAGFSIVTYTGTGANATVGHGLGVTPSFIIVKSRSNTTDWQGYHGALGKDYTIQLMSTGAAINVSNYWNGGVSSTTFGINGAYDGINANGYTYVAYCFSPVAGYSAMGSFSGSSSDVFVWTGFRPRFILVKCSNTTGNWTIIDTARTTYNSGGTQWLYPNLSNAEGTTSVSAPDILSNGFRFFGSTGGVNESGKTYIYLAVAESPFQYARAR